VRIVYCGGCNPVIDRVALVAEVSADAELAALDATVFVSGCSRSCAAEQMLVRHEPRAVVVAGQHVDGTYLAPGELAERVKQALRSRGD